jgi:hypothetical protein
MDGWMDGWMDAGWMMQSHDMRGCIWVFQAVDTKMGLTCKTLLYQFLQEEIGES